MEWWLQGLEGEENETVLFHWHRLSVWEHEKVLEMDSGDDCPTIGIHLMSLNCTFIND